MSLPTPWVEKIFQKLTINYGTDFAARYKGIELGLVKTDWADELSFLVNRPDAIAFALSNLPDRVPTAQQFKALCLSAPAPSTPALAYEPKADPARVAQELAKLAPMRESVPTVDHRAWAKTILLNHKGGLRVNQTALRMAREAVRAE